MECLCRTCGSPLNPSTAKNIYGQKQYARRLIETIIGSKLKHRSNLPKHICLRCQRLICQVASFRGRCLRVQKYFGSRRKKLMETTYNDPLSELHNATENESAVQANENEIFETEKPSSFIDFHAETDAVYGENQKDLTNDANKDVKNDEKSCAPTNEEYISQMDNTEICIEDIDAELVDIIEYDEAEEEVNDVEVLDSEMSPAVSPTPDDVVHQEPSATDDEEDFENDVDADVMSESSLRSSFLDEGITIVKQKPNTGKTEKKKNIYICEYCGTTWTDATNFKMHMYRHTGTKSFKCNQCGLAYYTNFLLKRHELTHLMNHTCNYCGKKFRYSCAKKRHERTHSMERPFKCKFCEKGFYDTNSCKTHEFLHFGDRKFHCEICDMWFINRKYLQTHTKSKSHIRNEQNTQNLNKTDTEI